MYSVYRSWEKTQIAERMKENITVLCSCNPVLSVLHFRGLCKTSLKKLHDIKVTNLVVGNAKGGAAQISRGIALTHGKYLG